MSNYKLLIIMRQKFVLLFLVMGSTLFCSCYKDEIAYSCNESVNFWVKENLETIHSMKTTDWNYLEDSLKIAVYRAFTPQQRIDFWHNRFKEVKAMKWTPEEILHIEKAESFLENHLHFLSKKRLSGDELDELDLFGYDWITEGIELYGWTSQTGNLIIGTGFTIKNESKDQVPLQKCHCHADNIIFHTCWADSRGCFKEKCDQNTTMGCGFFLMEDCDGICL